MEQISPTQRAKMTVANELKQYLIEWFDYRLKVVEITILFDKMTITHKDQIQIDKLADIKNLLTIKNTKEHGMALLNQMKVVMQLQHMKTFNNILDMFEEAGIETIQLKIGYEDFHTFNLQKPKEQKES